MDDPRPVIKAERLDIAAESGQVLSALKSGDFVQLRRACGRLCALAENHYPEFLSRAVLVIANANSLNDSIRSDLITANEQQTATNQLIERAVGLLSDIQAATPISRVSQETLSKDDKVQSEKLAERIERHIERGETPSRVSNSTEFSDEERDLVRLIVESQDPGAKGKLVVAQDITRSYRGTSFQLRPISLELNRGEILGIVGVNASGKTTLLRLLLGELKPDFGELTYPSLETPGKKRSWIKIKQRIGYVSRSCRDGPAVFTKICGTSPQSTAGPRERLKNCLTSS